MAYRASTIVDMHTELIQLLDRQGGVATSAQLLSHMPRRAFEAAVRTGVFDRLWQGIYAYGEATEDLRLRGLDLMTAAPVAVCLGTAAARYGFDTEHAEDLHVLNPQRGQLRSADGLVVHRREGAPVVDVAGRPATEANWTAVEVARSLRRPRALATLDAALRSGTCNRTDLWRAALAQAGRRGIVDVRALIPWADGRSESPMESEARLVMIDGGLPVPALQHEIIDGNGDRRRFDFAWPDVRVAAEYEGVDWHSGPEELRRDRRRLAAVQDVGWTVVPILFEDVRFRYVELVARIDRQLCRARAA